jgi:hypothetical protein
MPVIEKRSAVSLRWVLTIGLTAAGVAGAGCAATGSAKPGDGSAPGDVAGDIRVDAGTDVPAPETGSSVQRIYGGAPVVILGITEENHVIFQDFSQDIDDPVRMPVLRVIPAGGGQAVTLGKNAHTLPDWWWSPAGRGPGVIFQPTTMSGSGLSTGPISVWTAKYGVKQLATSGVTGFDGVISRSDAGDPPLVAYFDNALGFSADLFIAKADGTGRLKLANTAFLGPSCSSPQLQFVGSILVARLCENGQGSVVSFKGPSWTAVKLAATNDQQARFVIDPGGKKVLVKAATTGLTVFPIEGGAGVLIDANGHSGVFTGDGANVIYTATGPTTERTLRRSPVTAPSPVTLGTLLGVGQEIPAIWSISPDDRRVVLGVSDPGSNGQNTLLASASDASSFSVQTLPKGLSGAFTYDSSRLLFRAGEPATLFKGGGELLSFPAMGQPTTLATNAWAAWAIKGSQILLFDNIVRVTFPFPGNFGTLGDWWATVDIGLADAVTPGTGTMLVKSADPFAIMTAKRDVLVYAISSPVSKAGIWTTPIR